MANIQTGNSLKSAFKTAADQVSGAAALVGKGCSHKEAAALKIGVGPINCVYEFRDVQARYLKGASQDLYETSRMIAKEQYLDNFRLVSSSKVILPKAVKDFVGGKNQRRIMDSYKYDLPSTHLGMDVERFQERKELFETIDKSSEIAEGWKKLYEAADNIQTATGYPAYTTGHVATALSSISALDTIPAFLTMAVILVCRTPKDE